MATFEIVGPDGRTYEIEAPTQEAAIAAFQSFVQAPGGVTTSPEAVADLEARMGAAARGAADTATFGTADELAAFLGSSLVPDMSFSDLLAQSRAQTAADIENYPGARLSGQILGGATAGMALGGPLDDMLRAFPALAGSGAGARIGRGALAGGIEGAAYGLGSGEGLGGRLSEGVSYGLMGAGAGAAVPVLTEAANIALLRPIGGALGLGNQQRAANSVIRAMEDAGFTPDQITNALRQAAAEGQDVFNVADVLGIAGRRALSGATTQPGTARVLAENVLDARQNNQTARLAQFVEEAMNSRNTRAQQEAAARVARGAAADINYTAARANAQPVDLRNVIGLIDQRIGPMQSTTIQGEGVDALLNNIRNRIAGTVNVQGQSLPGQLSDLPRLIRLYGEIGDDIQAATRAGRGFEANQLRDVQQALGQALEEASPDWRAANASFAGASRVVEAPEAGQRANVGTVRAADVADQWADIEARINRIQGLTPAQRAQYIEEARQGFRTGYANRDLAAMEAATDTRNMANALFLNDRQRANYGLMATDPDLFFNRVMRESEMSRTRNAALGGSQTAANLADQAMIEGSDVGIISNLLSGNFMGATGQATGRVLQAARGSNEATREAVARALLSSDPNAFMRSILPAQRNEAMRRTIEATLRGGTRGLLGFGQ